MQYLPSGEVITSPEFVIIRPTVLFKTFNQMPINEERFRSAINSNTLRNAGNELLAEIEQLGNELAKAPRDDVMIGNALTAVKNKAYGLIGSYSDITNPAPMPQPTPEVKPDPSPVAEAEPEVPAPVVEPVA